MVKDKDDDFNDLYGDDEFDFTREPKFTDSDSLNLRLNPKPLLEDFKLRIMGLYKVDVQEEDEDGGVKTSTRIKSRKGFKALVNKQGAEEIISLMESAVNTHSVQGNFLQQEQYNHRMEYIAKDLTKNFIAKRKDWGASIRDINYLIDSAIIMIEIFLTRPINNLERLGLSETYKESRTTHQDFKRKENPLKAALERLTK